jgi:putative oxidoreductase
MEKKDKCNFSYRCLVKIGDWFQSPILLLLRLYFGWMFIMAGLHKVKDISGTAAGFEALHIPMPVLSVYLAGYSELIGGACLILGLFARLVSIPLMITMIVAYFTAHYDGVKSIATDPSNFVNQAPFNYLLASLLIFAFGPGVFSLDYIFCKWYRGSDCATDEKCCKK